MTFHARPTFCSPPMSAAERSISYHFRPWRADLYGDPRKGRRPSWSAAAPNSPNTPALVEAVVDALRARGATVATGVFGALMAVESVNDGPFTVLVDILSAEVIATSVAVRPHRPPCGDARADHPLSRAWRRPHPALPDGAFGTARSGTARRSALRGVAGGAGARAASLAGHARAVTAALSTTVSAPFAVCAATDWVARWACSVAGPRRP